MKAEELRTVLVGNLLDGLHDQSHANCRLDSMNMMSQNLQPLKVLQMDGGLTESALACIRH